MAQRAETIGGEMQKPNVPRSGKPLIADWLSQFEEQTARDFRRRTGLDYRSTIAQIIEAAEPFPGMHVLDLPTGSGVIARQFVGKVGDHGRIIGVEESREKLEQARLAAQSTKVSLHLEWKVMPLEKLSFPDNSFDLVTSLMALHRLPAEKFLAEIHRVLKPGGRMLVTDELAPEQGSHPLRLSVRRTYYRYIRRDHREADAQFLTTEEMMHLLGEIGFSQIMFRALRQRSKTDRVLTLIKAVK